MLYNGGRKQQAGRRQCNESITAGVRVRVPTAVFITAGNAVFDPGEENVKWQAVTVSRNECRCLYAETVTQQAGSFAAGRNA